jgi:4-amino-4-deoxy-L-arabinose transferase-like glycosyltransferase
MSEDEAVVQTRDRRTWALGVFACAIVIVAIQVAWLIANRRGYPLDIDEAGYISIALVDHAALSTGGLHGFWHAIQVQTPNAPLVPALTALVYTVHTGILASFAVTLGFLVLLVMAVYGIAAELAGPRVGALAALVTATSPGALGFSTLYVFALPAAALLACAVYALVKSDGLSRTPWALAMGVSLGLMLLARTVTVAFLPAVLLAVVVAVASRGREGLGRRAANTAVVVLGTVAVAALWYARNLAQVSDYLTSFGYGGQSAQYGSDEPLLSLARWSRTAHKAGFESLHLPLFLALTAGLCALAVIVVIGVRRSGDRRAALGRLLRSRALSLAIVVAGGYVALTSSRNGGLGFSLPLVPIVIVLGLLALRELPRLRRPLAFVLAAIAALNLAAASDAFDFVSKRRDVDVPVLGVVPVTDGEPAVVGAVRQQVPGPPLHFVSRERAWRDVEHELAGFLIAYADGHPPGNGPVVAFGTRNRLVNTNTVGLAALLWFRRQVPFAQLTTDQGGDTPAAYARYLSEPEHGQPNLLITASSAEGDFEPHVTQAKAEQAARSLGFRVVHTVRLPDGRILRVWWLAR